jgi:hypothetical protein
MASVNQTLVGLAHMRGIFTHPDFFRNVRCRPPEGRIPRRLVWQGSGGSKGPRSG